jgi:molybdopterin converting factor small subunit
MRVNVQTFSMIRTILGQKTIELELPEGATVREAMQKLVEMGGPEARKMFLSPDGESLKIAVLINGASAGLNTSLHDGTEINLMVTIGGGEPACSTHQ